MKQLLDERDALIRQAELFRDYQLHCATVLYESEKAGAQDEYNVGSRAFAPLVLELTTCLGPTEREARVERENAAGFGEQEAEIEGGERKLRRPGR